MTCRSLTPCLFTIAALVAAPLLAERTETFVFAADELTVGHLIGAVTVEGHGGRDFEVEVRVRGADSGRFPLEMRQREGSRARLEIVFPLDREQRYVYPEIGDGRTQIRLDRRSGDDDGWLRELIDSVTSKKIEVTGGGRGVEVWADLTVRAPFGRRLDLRHGVGRIRASDLEGENRLQVKAGRVEVERARGSLVVDTGSGRVEVSDVQGDLLVDTGSGSVVVRRFDGSRLSVDTGSGSVRVAGARTRHLAIDTGSGSVTAEDVTADSATIDTGSGGVELILAEMGTGEFEIDTGSGGITLLMPSYASAQVEADTGSGGISVDLPQFDTLHRERDEIVLRVGGGDAQVRLDTGSGSIRIGRAD